MSTNLRTELAGDSLVNRLELLRHNRLLRGCQEEVLARIAPLVALADVSEGTVIFRQGEAADAMYLEAVS